MYSWAACSATPLPCGSCGGECSKCVLPFQPSRIAFCNAFMAGSPSDSTHKRTPLNPQEAILSIKRLATQMSSGPLLAQSTP